MRGWMPAVLALAMSAAVASAAQDDMESKIINQPVPERLTVYGMPTPPPIVRARDVEGGKVRRITVAKAGANAHEIGLLSATTEAVRKGDRLVVAFYARTHAMGEQSATIPAVQLQLSQAPYTPVFSGTATVTSQLDFHQVQGVADRDYAAGELSASLHLAGGRHTIDIGPLVILNLSK